MGDKPKLQKYFDEFPKINVDDLLELFRDLRQETTSKSAQDSNAREITPCLSVLSAIVNYIGDGNADNVIDKFVLNVCARVGVQFLGNAIVEHSENQALLWSHSDLLRKLLMHNDSKMKNYVCMIYYNLILPDSASDVREQILSDNELIVKLLVEATEGLSEFPQFIIEKLLLLNLLDRLLVDSFSIKHKTYIYDVLCSVVSKDKDNFTLDNRHVERIAKDYIRHTEVVLNGTRNLKDEQHKDNGDLNKETNSETNGTSDTNGVSRQNGTDVDGNSASAEWKYDPRMTVKLLSTLCTLSSNDKYNKCISDNSSLVINTMYVLRALKMSGEQKDSGDCLDSINSNEALTGFKAELIRLLGNTCWKHRKNQDLIRDNKCIELILECCKLDEKNPFIKEWAIMAIRNLCEDNKENQEFINSLKLVSEADVEAARQRVADVQLDQQQG